MRKSIFKSLKQALLQPKQVRELQFHSRSPSLSPEIGKLTRLEQLTLWRVTRLPPEIGQLSELTSLDLRGPGVPVLPPEIGRLKKLTRLYIAQRDPRRGLGLTALPPEIGRLKRLELLNISGCSFEPLPEEFAALPLKHLACYDCGLTSLPAAVLRLRKLESLSLFGEDVIELPPELVEMPKLRHLIASELPRQGLPEAFAHFKRKVRVWLQHIAGKKPTSTEQQRMRERFPRLDLKFY
jgi:Leucine-rich repeat (LRR) protein